MNKRLSIVMVLIVTSCAANNAPVVPDVDDIKVQKEAEYARKLELILLKDATEDARSAVRAGFPQLLTYYRGRSDSLYIPGLSAVQQTRAKDKCETKAPESMGDVIYGGNHLKYRQALSNYAVQYNRVIAGYCLR